MNMKIRYWIILQFFLIKTIFAVHFLEFKTLTEGQRQIHAELVKNVLLDKNNKSKNYFCVALKIVYKDNSEKIFIIKDIVKKDGKNFRSRNYPSLKNNPSKQFSPSFISGIHEKDFFHDKIDDNEQCKAFKDNLLKNKYSVENFFNDLNLPEFRKLRENHALTHSEFRFITYFFEEQEKLLQEIFSEGKQVKAVELHGFTLRDMCDHCYHHFQLFFQKFKELIQTNYPECETVTFFISSLFSYDHSSYDFVPISDTIKLNDINCISLRKKDCALDIKQTMLKIASIATREEVDPELKRLLKRSWAESKVNSESLVLEILPLPQGEEIIIEGAQIHLKDVATDGNCGTWALLQALYPEENFIAPTEEVYRTMVQFRISVANLLKEDNVIKKRIMSKATSVGDLAHWLYTDDFRYFAQAIGRPIGIIVYGDGYRIYEPNGEELIYDNMLMFRMYLNQHHETLTICLIGNHYQAVTSIKDQYLLEEGQSEQ